MKKIISYMIVLVLMLSLVGCGGNSKTSVEDKGKGESEKPTESDASEETEEADSETEKEEVLFMYMDKVDVKSFKRVDPSDEFNIEFDAPFFSNNYWGRADVYSAGNDRYFIAYLNLLEDYTGKKAKDVVAEFFPYIIKNHEFDILPKVNSELVAELEETVTINGYECYHFVGKIVGDYVTLNGDAHPKEQQIAFYTLVKDNQGYAFYGIEDYKKPGECFEELKYNLDVMVSTIRDEE